MRPKSILIVDDDPDVRQSLAQALTEDGTAVRVAGSATRALGALSPPPDVILLDVRMPDMTGLDLLPLLRERVPSADVALMTAFDDMTTVVAAMRPRRSISAAAIARSLRSPIACRAAQHSA